MSIDSTTLATIPDDFMGPGNLAIFNSPTDTVGTSLVFLAPFNEVATVTGTYLLMLNFSSSAPASLEIYVDGVASPETAATVGTSGSTSSVAMLSLSAGDHLNLVNTSGGFEQIDNAQLTIIRLQ